MFGLDVPNTFPDVTQPFQQRLGPLRALTYEATRGQGGKLDTREEDPELAPVGII
jgi:hypothetical protein